MSALRLPQHLADPAHIDSGEAHLRFDLLEELDSALGHAERRVEATLLALREFDLKQRLFKYPCSYLIYTESFDALPPSVKERIYRRLWAWESDLPFVFRLHTAVITVS